MIDLGIKEYRYDSLAISAHLIQIRVETKKVYKRDIIRIRFIRVLFSILRSLFVRGLVYKIVFKNITMVIYEFLRGEKW